MQLRIALVLLVTAATAAVADPAPTPSAADRATRLAEDDCARARRAKKICVLSMGSEGLEGGVPAREGAIIAISDRAELSSLIRIRSDFRAEIIRGLERL